MERNQQYVLYHPEWDAFENKIGFRIVPIVPEFFLNATIAAECQGNEDTARSFRRTQAVLESFPPPSPDQLARIKVESENIFGVLWPFPPERTHVIPHRPDLWSQYRKLKEWIWAWLHKTGSEGQEQD